MAGVKNVVAITSAKVPIIKLFHTQVMIIGTDVNIMSPNNHVDRARPA